MSNSIRLLREYAEAPLPEGKAYCAENPWCVARHAAQSGGIDVTIAEWEDGR
jgi:hypothetical protein